MSHVRKILRHGRVLRGRLSWEARLLIAVLTLTGAVIAVFRVTIPDTQPLVVDQSGPALDAANPDFALLLEAYTGARIEDGNRIELLLNGDGTYPRLWDDLRSARRSISLQSYYALPGAIADTLATILAAQARRGIAVRVLLDAFGAPMPRAWIDGLARAGVRVAMLRPIHWHSMHGAADRSHVRVVVVDGRIAYTGGFGFADYWAGDGRREGQWRETNARIEGPAAFQFQAVFGTGWVEATGQLLSDASLFDASAPAELAERRQATLLFTTTTTGSTAAERFLALMIASARHRLYVTNSYFVPNDDFCRLLADAAARGVDVRILTGGTRTDVRTTRYAGRFRYERLLRAGIRIYEYEAATLHAKTMTVDGLWTTVGSMNLDSRSLAFNDESTLLARNATLTTAMDAAFAADLTLSREITLEAWRRRSLGSRLLETGANLLSALL